MELKRSKRIAMSSLNSPFYRNLVLLILILLTFSACTNNFMGGEEGIISINLGGRSKLPWPPNDYGILEQLEYKIVLTSNIRKIEFPAKGGTNFKRTVPVGFYNINIDAFYKGKLYSTGTNSIIVEAGRNNTVTIPMNNLGLICPDCEVKISNHPTCDEEGLEEINCIFKDHISKRVIDKLGHELIWEGEEATCTTSGTGKYICKICDYIGNITTTGSLGHYMQPWPSMTKVETQTIYCQRDNCNHSDERRIVYVTFEFDNPSQPDYTNYIVAGTVITPPIIQQKSYEYTAGLYEESFVPNPNAIWLQDQWSLNGATFISESLTSDTTTLKVFRIAPHTRIADNIVQPNNVVTAVNHVNTNAATYTLLIDSNLDTNQILYLNVFGVNLTIIGLIDERTITKNEQGSLFVLSSGAKLTIGDNVILKGNTNNNVALIQVNNTCTFIMTGTSMITGNINSGGMGQGGGVNVAEGGTFNMQGGTISGNQTTNNGGGVFFASEESNFSKSGGVIEDNTADGSGAQLFWAFGSLSRDTSLGANDDIIDLNSFNDWY